MFFESLSCANLCGQQKSISQNQMQKDFKRTCKGLLQNTASIFLHPLSAQLLVTSVRSVRTKVRSARTDVSKRQNNWIAEKRCCILPQFCLLFPQPEKGLQQIQGSIAEFPVGVGKSRISGGTADEVAFDGSFTHCRIISHYNAPA